MVPVFRVRAMAEALSFYRDLVGFTVHMVDPPAAPFYAVLSLNGDELHLLQDAGATIYRHAAIVWVTDVDAEWARLLARGHVPPDRPESPVHQGPLDQTWGNREFYIDDPFGNGLTFATRTAD